VVVVPATEVEVVPSTTACATTAAEVAGPAIAVDAAVVFEGDDVAPGPMQLVPVNPATAVGLHTR
jgi:hypothetical protein